MSSFLCFVCHSTVNMDTNEETRDKYKELVGMHLNQDSHLCHICCHVLNKFWLFRSVCLKRSMEYPVLFSEKGTIYLHMNDIEHFNLCPNNNCHSDQRKLYHNPSYYFIHKNKDINNIHEDMIHKNDIDYFNDNLDNSDIVSDYDYHVEEIQKETNDVINKGNSNKTDHFNNCFDDIINKVNEEKVKNVYYNENTHVMKNLSLETTTDINYDGLQSDNAIKHLNNDIINSNKYNLNSNNDNLNSNNDNLNSNNDKLNSNNDNLNLNNDNLILNNDNLNTENDNLILNNDIIDIYNTDSEVNEKEDHAEIRIYNKSKKKKIRKSKSNFEKIVLSLEEQKAELERNRRQKKYIEAEFKCYNCAMGFLFKDTYQTHMMRHEESNGEYRCTTCTLRFVTPAVFRAHTSLHTDRYKCTRCGLVMGLRRSKSHAVQCRGKTVHEVVTCHLCGNVFKDSSGLSQHLRRFHKLRTKNRTYSCTVCGKNYNNQAAVRTHMIKHIQRQFHCEQCPSTFSSPYMLNQHKKKHEATYHEQHYCATCKIAYTSRKSLLAHRRKALVHQRAVFECRICARLCPNRGALATHMRRVHASCKEYACNVCGKRYTTGPSLRRHEATHMPAKEGRLHMCHMCPRTFKSRSKLNRHLREVCEKDKLEEELSIYYNQHDI